MIGIIDYGLGNLYSLSNALTYIGQAHEITGELASLKRYDRLILPGVGAFEDAITRLNATGLTEEIRARAFSGTPLMGICLGMQLLFEVSYEYGCHQGLGLLKGQIQPIAERITQPLKVPQIGWNSLKFHRPGVLTRHIHEGDFVYYVHSYFADNCEESLVASSEYEIQIPGIVEKDNVCGTQFHPERSGEVGLNILRAFAEM